MTFTAEVGEKVVLLVLGWLFGLVGPAVVDAIRTRRTVRAIKKSLLLELAELQIRVGGAAWYLAAYIGAVDRNYLEWLKAVHDRYRGVRGDTQMAAMIEQMLSRPDADIANGVAQYAANASSRRLRLRRYPTPVMDMALQHLSRFDPSTQQRLLELKTSLVIFDELAADAREFFSLTFQKHVADNLLEQVGNNLRSTYRQALDVCKNIVDTAETIRVQIAGA